MTVLIVTGTGTDVGKTIATAAIAACGTATRHVVVVKPAQTGTGDGTPGDLHTVTRLTGLRDVHEFARYPDPLSPHHAARISGLPALELAETVRQIVDLDAARDDALVLVEGAGGLLVPFTDEPHAWTIADLAVALHAPAVVVARADLGTLNHTALTVGRLAEDGVALAGIVVGSWPTEPDLAMRCNLDDLAALDPTGEPAGVLPAGLGAAKDFPVRARQALGSRFGGTFDWPAFRAGVPSD